MSPTTERLGVVSLGRMVSRFALTGEMLGEEVKDALSKVGGIIVNDPQVEDFAQVGGEDFSVSSPTGGKGGRPLRGCR